MPRKRTTDTDPEPQDLEIQATAEADPEYDLPVADRLPLQAQPARRRLPVAEQHLPVVCSSIYALVSTGARGKLDAIPLHEVPLLMRKLRLQEPAGETPRVMAEFPEHRDRRKPLTMPQLRAEYARLVDRYSFDKPGSHNGETTNLVADFYGNGLGVLRSSMLRLEAGLRQIRQDLGEDETISDEQMQELVKLADEEFDMDAGGTGEIDYQPFEPAGRGAVVGG